MPAPFGPMAGPGGGTSARRRRSSGPGRFPYRLQRLGRASSDIGQGRGGRQPTPGTARTSHAAAGTIHWLEKRSRSPSRCRGENSVPLTGKELTSTRIADTAGAAILPTAPVAPVRGTARPTGSARPPRRPKLPRHRAPRSVWLAEFMESVADRVSGSRHASLRRHHRSLAQHRTVPRRDRGAVRRSRGRGDTAPCPDRGEGEAPGPESRTGHPRAGPEPMLSTDAGRGGHGPPAHPHLDGHPS